MIVLMDRSVRERITADLNSGVPELVAEALETLDQAWRRLEFGPLPLPEPICLEAFNDSVPVEILEKYISVVQNYPDFEPTPSGSDIRHALIEAVIRYSSGEVALNVALAIRVNGFPEHAVSDALSYLQCRGLSGTNETMAALCLINCLLDSESTRKATVEVLRIWAMMDRFPEVIKEVWEQLNDEEQARLEVDNEI